MVAEGPRSGPAGAERLLGEAGPSRPPVPRSGARDSAGAGGRAAVLAAVAALLRAGLTGGQISRLADLRIRVHRGPAGRRRRVREMRSELVRLVRRYPLAVFFVLACVFSWWAWPLYAAGLAPGPIAGFGPFLAALVVLPITHGRAGVVTLLRRMVRWRVGVGWYAVALLLPVAISLTAMGLNLGLGAPAPAAARSPAGRAWS